MRKLLTLCTTATVLALVVFLTGAALAAPVVDPLQADRAAGGATPVVLARDGQVEPIDPSLLECNGTITFDDVPGGAAPGVNYDGVFESNGASFAERFVGQSLVYNGNFDVLDGTTGAPLNLQAGVTGQNLGVYAYNSNVLYGIGPLGFPDYDAIGEGSIAVLFDYDQSQFGFSLVGGNLGSAYVNFFRRNGSLIDTITITNLGDVTYAFRRVGGLHDIAGISIHNDDLAGIAFDNLCHDVAGVPGSPPVCNAGGPYTCEVNVETAFAGSGSYDLDGQIVSYQWDFGDGLQGTGELVSHTYASEGTLVVALCVTDDAGLQSCCETTVTVRPQAATENQPWGSVKALYR